MQEPNEKLYPVRGYQSVYTDEKVEYNGHGSQEFQWHPETIFSHALLGIAESMKHCSMQFVHQCFSSHGYGCTPYNAPDASKGIVF